MDSSTHKAPSVLPREMIAFTRGNLQFNYRIVGIAINSGRVLLHKAETEDFWTLPVGRGEMREAATETLKREMQEEIGTDVKVERLVWLVENFFEYEERSYHELALYFLMSFPQDSPLYEYTTPFTGYEETIKLIFQWHSLDELEQTILYPSFLRHGLTTMPAYTEHVVHVDEIG